MGDLADDAALLAALSAGDETACRQLVRRHLRAATLFAAQLTGDRDDAEDIVQAAFILAVERAGDLDRTRPFAPWLFGVIRRLAAKTRSRRARRWALWQRWAAGDDGMAHAGDVAMDADSDAELVRRHLERLPDMQRACFELVVLRDLAAGDVAAMYEVSASTVRQHVFRARRALRVSLEPVLGVRARRWVAEESAE